MNTSNKSATCAYHTRADVPYYGVCSRAERCDIIHQTETQAQAQA